MKLVILESPFAANDRHTQQEHIEYARRCVADCLRRGESPYASHLLLTQDGILDDDIPEQRELGINAGFAWRNAAEKTVVYIDMGISDGMAQGMFDAAKKGIATEIRTIGGVN